MPWLVLGVCLLVALLLLAQWFVTTRPAQILKTLRYVGAGLLALIALFLALTGRFGQAAPFGIGALMLFLSKMPRLGFPFGSPGNPFSGFNRSPSSGKSSDVRTAWLSMHLDHDSGELTGEVIKGAFRGQRLEDLDFDGLIRLLGECGNEDAQSAQLLATYIERKHGPDWQEKAAEAGAAGQRPGGGRMTVDEAYEVLGLAPGASEEEIREAHRGLMKKHHPDQGGSTYFAAKINEAKDVLLRPRA